MISYDFMFELCLLQLALFRATYNTQVYYERVNSHSASLAFNFTYCGVKDISPSVVRLENFPATKIRFSKGFSFANLESEREFEQQRAAFFDEYERRDDYVEVETGHFREKCRISVVPVCVLV